jgi:hypothetical protein
VTLIAFLISLLNWKSINISGIQSIVVGSLFGLIDMNSWIDKIWKLLTAESVPWLLAAVVGGFIGVVLPYVGRLIAMLWNRSQKFPFQGDWHHYYYNFDPDQPVLHHEVWSIANGYKHRYHVTANDSRNAGPAYIGHMELIKGHALIHLRGNGHEEYVVSMFPIPIPGASACIVGVALAQDFRGRLTSPLN